MADELKTIQEEPEQTPVQVERRTKRSFTELITFKLDRTLAICSLLIIGLGAEAIVLAIKQGDVVTVALNVVSGVVGAFAGYIGGRSQGSQN